MFDTLITLAAFNTI